MSSRQKAGHLDGQLNELQDQLKNKRVESAMMDQELAKINEEMKIALESSFFEQDDKNKDWKWEIADQKMSSYMDIAQLSSIKSNIKSIEEIEQEIAKLKNQKSSISNVINEKERTSHKKIKQMEGMYATRTSDNAGKKNWMVSKRLSNSQDLHLIMVTVLMFLARIEEL